MNHLDRKSLLFAIPTICLSLTNSGCDRSWRDENFVAPQATVGEGDVPPRVRPTVPPVGGTAIPQPGQPPPTQLPDGGTGPSLENDASVEPNMPNETDGYGDTGTSQTSDEGDTQELVSGETRQVHSDETYATAPPAATHAEDKSTDEVEPPEPEPFSKRKLLEAASACAVGEYEAFATRARALDTAVRAVEDDATLNVAREAFVSAMLQFQRVEGFRIGPAARAMDPGGQDLRDWMYSFPTQNRCQIDRNLVSGVYASNFSSVLFNARGLLALEYLLFERGSTNVCTAGADINIKGTWAALSSSELNSRRNAYARVVTADITARAEQLVEAWSEGGGNFMAEVVQAGDGSSTFATQQAALNAYSHALFYVERELKDFKLGLPLGITADCTDASGCPHMAELPYAGLSGPSIAQNLYAFRLLFEGCGESYEGHGFDDWLRAADQGDLADRMLTKLVVAQQTVATLPRLLEDAFYDAPSEARAVHTAVKGVTDLLKTEFVSVLNLELPMTAEGDND